MPLSPLANRHLRMMGQVVTIEPRTGTTGNNTPAYGALTYHRAYINATGELFRNAQGQEEVSSATVHLHPLECNVDGTPKSGALVLDALPTTSRITWPDAAAAGGVAKPVILKVGRVMDFSGNTIKWEVHT